MYSSRSAADNVRASSALAREQTINLSSHAINGGRRLEVRPVHDECVYTRVTWSRLSVLTDKLILYTTRVRAIVLPGAAHNAVA